MTCIAIRQQIISEVMISEKAQFQFFFHGTKTNLVLLRPEKAGKAEFAVAQLLGKMDEESAKT